ncbi:MAG: cell wall metabolism sensor histidine kinase WalK [Planctomycetes bacterium]|nr:cell wall metabolism sensor histidine kinase WalK [Planctomycetota bacterium]
MADRFLPSLSLAAAVALVGAWAADAAYAELTWPMRLSAMTIIVALTAAGVAWGRRRAGQREMALRRRIEFLTAAPPDSLESESFPDFHPRDEWRTTLIQTRDCLKALAARNIYLEQARGRAEIRARRLEDEVRRVSDVLTNFSDPVLAVDAYDEVVLANDSARRMFGLEGESAEKRMLAQLEHCEALVELLNETRRHKSAVQRCTEMPWTGDDGVSRTYQVTCRTLATAEPEENDSARGAVAVLQDISPQKAIQKRNAEFVSSVSHEMKTPLTSIKAYVELLADGDAEDEATREEFLGVITNQTTRLQRLIDNLLNLARIEAGVVSVDKKPQSLNGLLEEAAEVVRPAAERKQIKLQCELSPLYLGVLVDRDMLHQSAINLLSNAVKYTPEGGMVTLRSRLDDGQAVFEVSDTGVGLAPEDCEKVFEKFYRVKKDQSMAPGTGLGLPLAKHIVEDVHGGALTVESVLGQGSTFRAALPLVGEMEK